MNAQVAVEALKKTKAQLKEAEAAGEQARRQLTQAQQAVADEQRRRLMAEQAAAAAKASAVTAERQAQRAEAAAAAAQSEAADVRRQLREVQAQLARVQAACESGAAAARRDAPAQQQQGALGAAAAAALQERVERMAAELERWRAALGPLAALAAGSAASGPGLAPPPAPVPAPPRLASPQKQRRGRRPAAAAAAAAGGTGDRPTSPREAQAAAAAAGAAPPQPAAEDARARAVRQVAARQAEAAAAAKRGPPAAAANVFAEALGNLEAGRPAKRAKQAAQLASQQQPAAQAAANAAAAAPRVATPTVAPAEPSLAVSANALPGGQPREHPAAADEAAQLLGSITAAAAPGGPGVSLEAVRRAAADLHFRLAEDRLPLLLLVRCFETAVLEGAASAPQGHLLRLPGDDEGQRQSSAAAAEASPDGWFGPAPLCAGSSREIGAPRLPEAAGPPFAVVWCRREALARRHLPWLLHCAAEIQRLHSARAAAAAALAAVSEDSEQPAGSGGETGDSFAAVLQRHMHREVISWCLAAGRGAGGGNRGGGRGGRVRHTETEACALAAATAALCRMAGSVEVRSGTGQGRCGELAAALWLSIPPACHSQAMLAATSIVALPSRRSMPCSPQQALPSPALCRVALWARPLQAFWALLLDLLTCPAAPATVLPPLAAAIDAWPAAVAAVGEGCGTEAAGGGVDAAARGSSKGAFHAALQRLCARAEDAAAGEAEQQMGSACSATAAADAPPPLLLERQPAAAAVYLRRLGRHAWGWQEGAAGDASAADGLMAAAARWRSGGGLDRAAFAAGLPDSAKAAHQGTAAAGAEAVPALAAPDAAPLAPANVAQTEADAHMNDVEEEEI